MTSVINARCGRLSLGQIICCFFLGGLFVFGGAFKFLSVDFDVVTWRFFFFLNLCVIMMIWVLWSYRACAHLRAAVCSWMTQSVNDLRPDNAAAASAAALAQVSLSATRGAGSPWQRSRSAGFPRRPRHSSPLKGVVQQVPLGETFHFFPLSDVEKLT